MPNSANHDPAIGAAPYRTCCQRRTAHDYSPFAGLAGFIAALLCMLPVLAMFSTPSGGCGPTHVMNVMTVTTVLYLFVTFSSMSQHDQAYFFWLTGQHEWAGRWHSSVAACPFFRPFGWKLKQRHQVLLHAAFLSFGTTMVVGAATGLAAHFVS